MQRALLLMCVCILTLVGIVAATGVWLTGQARAAMVHEVISSEATAASERAAEIADAVTVARTQLVVAANAPGAAEAIQRGDQPALNAALESASGNQGVVRLAVVADGNVLAATPPGAGPIAVDGDGPTFSTTPDLRDALVSLSVAVRDHAGVEVGRVEDELSIGKLVPHFARPFAGHHSLSTLVTSDGSVLSSSAAKPTKRVQSPEVLALLRGGRTRGISFHSASLKTDRIAAMAPVEGFPIAVIVGANATAARTPAAALVRRLASGIAVSALSAALVLAAALVVIARTGRRMESDLATLTRSWRRLHRQHADAQEDAERDVLTGARNRRAFEREVSRLRATDGPAGMVLIDLDGLKVLNDTFGHAAGDEAIRRAADAIVQGIRPNDLLARIGGDEFAVVLTEVTADQVAALATRVIDAINHQYLEGGMPLRASVGYASGSGADVDKIFADADAAMYEAKTAAASGQLGPLRQ